MSNLGQHIEVIGNNAVFLSFTYDNWTWSYRTGAFSTREQKRLLFSPHSDTTATVVYEGTKTYAHLWNYNLVGAGGEELVQYRGIQMAAPNAADTGRRVYMAPYKYIVPGGEIRILADTNDRELCLTDHLGSVRCVISTNTIVKKDYDYDPFGRYSFPYSPLPEEGFVSEKNDFEEGESNLMQMGVRMYSPQIGRFLAVDPLFEMMPGHNPYHYAFNSPLMWKDPSGLAPEKEKNGEELQFWVKKQTQSSPIDPGEEYWEWIDDKYITYYFSAENDAGFYPGSMIKHNLSMFAMLGVNGGSSSGGGNQGAGPRTQNALPQGNGSKTESFGYDLRIVMDNIEHTPPQINLNHRYNDGLSIDGELIPGDDYYRLLTDFYNNPTKYEINPFTGEPTGYGAYNPGDEPMYEAVLWITEAKTADLIINLSIKYAPKVIAAIGSIIFKSNKVNITHNGLAHTLERHTMNGIEKWLNKSKFFNANEVEYLLKQANSIIPSIQPNTGNYVRIVDAHRFIGFDKTTGTGTSIYTVITNSNGNLITGFPGLP